MTMMKCGEGLSFSQARRIVVTELNSSIKSLSEISQRESSTNTFSYLILFPPLLVSLVFVLSVVLGEYTGSSTNLFGESAGSSGVWTAVCLIFGLTWLNYVVVYRFQHTENFEVLVELKSILADYVSGILDPIDAQSDEQSERLPINFEDLDRPIMNISSGHSQVSIVTCFRSGQWTKIPVLLLAKGDIIALMGGDIAPAKLHELEDEESNLVTPVTDSKLGSWRVGKCLDAGAKVYLRQDEASSNANNEKHRLLAADSTEILKFSGDLRCFLVAETPIVAFLSHLRGKQIEETRDADRRTGISFIRQLFEICVWKSIRFLKIFLLLYALSAIARLILLCGFANKSSEWPLTVSIPLSTLCLFFGFPICLPLTLLIGDAVSTAMFLAHSEVNLDFQSSENTSSKEKAPLTASIDKSAPTNIELRRRASSSMASSESGPDLEPLPKDTRKQKNTIADETAEVDRSAHEYPREEDEFEFNDDDIDQRAEDIAEEVSTQVQTNRVVQYFIRTICKRLSLFEIDNSNSTARTKPFLPIPFTQVRLLEILGAITMVCFIDDDIICENYSVTEEIFLLVDHKEDRTGLQRGNTEMGKNRHVEDASSHNPSSQTATNASRNAFIRTGIVLDLHGNPEATGSRFEDPDWWRYLPSLKPLGLNALLTYSYTNKEPLPSQTPTQTPLFPNHFYLAYSMPSGSSLLGLPYCERDESAVLRNATSSPNTSHWAKKVEGNLKNNLAVSPHHNHHFFSPHLQEKALVHHIRDNSIPLELLRELSEEIGFVGEDIQYFSKKLEVNVLAPGLENTYILEDSHQWGQEESRRRGTLTPQITATIFKDSRGGGMQMMSTGDPSLLLNYCREYWDGSSITPLTATDRKEVFSVFDRWRLEDYDVVAFSYSPIPTSLSISALTVSTSASVASSGNSGGQKGNVLFFVDPTRSEDFLRFRGKRGNGASNGKVSGSVRRKSGKIAQLVAESDGLSMDLEAVNPTLSQIYPVKDQIEDLANSGDRLSFEMLDLRSSARGESMESAKSVKNDSRADAGGLFLEISKQSERDSTAQLKAVTYAADYFGGVASTKTFSDEADLAQSPLYRKRSLSDSNIDTKLSYQSFFANSMLLSTAQPPLSSLFVKLSEQQRQSQGQGLGSDQIAQENGSNRFDGSLRSRAVSNVQGRFKLEYDSFDYEVSAERGNDEVELIGLDLLSEQKSEDEKQSSDVRTRLADSADNSEQKQDRLEDLSEVDRQPVAFKKSISLDHEIVAFTESKIPKSISIDLPVKPSRSNTLSYSSSCDSKEESSKSSNIVSFAKEATLALSTKSMPAVTKSVSSANIAGSSINSATFAIDRGRQESHGFTKRSKHQTQQQSFQLSRNSQRRNAGVRQLWSSLRQQVFLGMAASSVPIRPDVRNTMEDLTAAGVRFVYFSPRNMKRSKPIAEKIGISFDWNCAISLRDLEGEGAHDPHRHISNYADWDVMAKLPHGIKAIRNHLETVDNVPLLVSLYTDATPEKICDMVKIFRDYGEVVLTVGSGYREKNHSIFSASDLSTSVSMLPSLSANHGELPRPAAASPSYPAGQRQPPQQQFQHIPARVQDLIELFPFYSKVSLCQGDILLSFRLVGLGTVPLIQTPHVHTERRKAQSTGRQSLRATSGRPTASPPSSRLVTVDNFFPSAPVDLPQSVRLSVLLEAIRNGRIFLLNSIQCLAFMVLSFFSLGTWPIVANAVPLAIPPSVPPPIALLFVCIYVPAISLAILVSPAQEGLMKNTPRKNNYFHSRGMAVGQTEARRNADETRFLSYLFIRSSFIAFSIFLVGWFTTASYFGDQSDSISTSLRRFYDILPESEHRLSDENLTGFYLTQDMMAHAALLGLLSQSYSLLERGQKLVDLEEWRLTCPSLMYYPAYYAAAGVCLLIHLGVMAVRATLRDGGSYSELHWQVWLVLLLPPLLLGALGSSLNLRDDKFYRRHLQFLRLEFDTRLGMHSPR